MLGFGLGLNKWRRVGGGYVGLLDLFPNAAAAYSLRKLRAAYSGAAVRVRESGGNTEADIGFDANGDLDTSALLAHCGANDGFVTVWYDQSLSNDATQTTASNQPKIVSAGSLVTENGKPAVDFDGVDDGLFAVDNATFDALGVNGQCQLAVASLKSVATSNITAKGNYRPGLKQVSLKISYANVASNTALQSTSNIVIGDQYLLGFNATAISGTNTTVDIILNGVIDNSGVVTAADYNNAFDFSIGQASASPSAMNGTIQELIVFDDDKASSIASISANINTFYSIYP